MRSDDIELIYQLSPMQQAMLFHSLLAPGSGVYVVQLNLRLTGPLDVEALARAWRAVVERHGVLRTDFHWEGLEHPVQVVHRRVELPIARESWRGLAAAEQQARLESHLAAERERGFDLSTAPLMRLALFELDAGAHQLAWSQHHLLLDGWSLGILLRDLFSCYAAFAAGRQPALGRARSYRDYIGWLKRQDGGRAEVFWRAALAGFERPTPLVDGAAGEAAPTDHRASRRRELRLPAAATAALRDAARRSRVTVNTAVQGAWALLLAGATGERDVVFGSTVAGRPAELPGADAIVGLFINTLPVRAQVDPERPLAAWLAELQERQAEVRRYEHAPLVDVQRWSALPPGEPLFDHILIFENYPSGEALAGLLPGLALSRLETNELTNYPANLLVSPGDELSLVLIHDLRRVPATAADRWLARLARLLAAFAADPERRLGDLPALGEAERHQLVAEWNDTAAPLPAEVRVERRIARQAARAPDAVAVSCDGAALSYGALIARAGRLARRLRRLGVGAETVVGLAVERTVELPAALLGILAAGGAYLPLDPHYPAARLAEMAEDGLAGASPFPVLVSERRLSAVLAGWCARAGAVRVELDGEQEADEGGDAGAELAGEAAAESLAYVLFTSGSTGRPKGVQVAHRGLANLLSAMLRATAIGPADVLLALTTLSFDIAGLELFLPLLCGARVELVPREVARDGERLRDRLAETGATLVQATPATWRLLLGAGWTGDGRLRALCGGEALPADLAERLLAQVGALWNVYGPTETTIWSTLQTVRPGERISIGRPLANSGVYLLSAGLAPVPQGAVGELYLGGVGVARGYRGRPDLTAERFVPDPFAGAPGGRLYRTGAPGARLYRTGDLGRQRPDGTVELLGRADQQVKLRGFRIELGEIEAALGRHPAVREAAVAAREDRPGDLRLVAYVVPSGEPPLLALMAEELRADLAERLPEAMVPRAYVTLAALPRTPNGKLDRRALPSPEAAGGEAEAPRTPAEELLAGIWREVLRREGGERPIGRDDDFFALGGHSLLATQVVSRVREVLGVGLPLRGLFEAPRLRELARRIETLRAGSAAPPGAAIAPACRAGDLPLSFAQRRLWFLDRLEPGSAAYNLPLAVRLSGGLDARALAASLAEIVRRHEALRTRFVAGAGGEPAQAIDPAGGFALPTVDLRRLGTRAAAEAERLAAEDARRPFDLARGPLFRPLLLNLGLDLGRDLGPNSGETEHVFLGTMHHAVSDGWSMGVLVRELGALYAALSAGRPSPLPALPIQYADFAAWQRGWLQGAALEAELGYWRERLAGLPARLELPKDRPRAAAPSRRGGQLSVTLGAAASEAVRALARSRGATPFMVLLAAWQALLGRHAGQDDLAVGTAIAGRNRLELEGLIGMFANTLVLRGELAGDPAFAELLAAARRETLAAYAHQELPFEALVEELAPERSLGSTPLFQAMLVLQNAPLPSLAVPGLRLSPLPLPSPAAKFELTLTLMEGEGGLAGTLEYAADLFDRTTVARLAAHLDVLLVAAGEAPERRLSELSALSAAEAHQLLAEWGAPREEAAAADSLPARFAAQAARRPEAVALTFEDGAWSYGELDRRSTRLAHRLAALGVGPEVPVALCAERSAELVMGVLAIVKAGGAYVPLDPAYPPERLAFVLADSRAPVLLAEAELVERLPAGGARVVALEVSDGVADDVPDEAASGADLPFSADPGQLAYVIYTSGSTGRPKGVAVTHGNAARLFDATESFGFGAADVWTLFHSIAFDFSVWELWGALSYGGRLVVVPYWVSRSPEAFYELLCRERVTVLNQTPSAFGQLVWAEETRLARGGAMAPDLRLVVFGGEALEPSLLAPWLARHGEERPLLVNMYGITETTVHVTRRPFVRRDVKRPASVVGRSLPDLSLRLLDGEGRPVPIGVAGEIHVGGAGVARGYLGRPELTAERFVPDPFGEPGARSPLDDGLGARLYRSGDLARWRGDGDLEYLGRADQQVKVRGFRIEPGEIEAALRELAGVREAAVSVWGSGGDRRLAAYLVMDGEEREPSELRRFLSSRLPEPMIPSSFVALPSLPRTPSGKVDRRALPSPEAVERPAARVSRGPRTPWEEVVVAAFREVLRAPEMGVEDDFFAAGGHSLLAVQAASRIEASSGVALPLKSLFEAPTAAALAARLAESPSDLARQPFLPPPLLPRQEAERAAPGTERLLAADGGQASERAGASMRMAKERRGMRDDDVELIYRLSPMQQAMLFHSLLAPGSGVYVVQTSLRLSGRLDAEALSRAWQEVVERHGVLRTSFHWEGLEQPVQVVHRRVELAIARESWRGLAAVEQRAKLEAHLAADRERGFDLSSAPLMRLALFELDAEVHHLVWSQHHLLLDGWSLGLLLRDLFTAYAAFAEGRRPALGRARSYREYIAWLKRQDLGEAEAFWRSALAGFARPTPLVEGGAPEAAATDHRAARRREVRLPEATTASLRAMARRARVTLNTAVQGAWALLLAGAAGERDVVFGSTVAGRPAELPGSESIVGLFINTLPVRVQVDPMRDVGSWLAGLQERQAEVRRYEHAPLADVQRWSGLPAGAPLFDHILVFENYPSGEALAGLLPGLAISGLETGELTNYPASLLVTPGDGLSLLLLHDLRRIAATVADRWLDRLACLLAAFAVDPERRLGDLPTLSEAERHQVVVEWGEAAEEPRGGAIAALPARFAAQAARRPEAVALTCEGCAWSYGELDRRSRALARRLLRLGVGPEVPVAICAERSPELVMGVLAISRSGGAYVPLDPSYPRERLAYVLEDSAAPVVLVQEGLADLLPAGGARRISLSIAGEGDAEDPLPAVATDQLAYVIYTSGSTGRPKGVAVTHGNAARLFDVTAEPFDLSAADVWTLFHSMAFDFSVWELWGALAYGGRLVVVPYWVSRSPEAFHGLLMEEQATVLNQTPSAFGQLAWAEEALLARGGAPLAGLRLVVFGGEALEPSLLGPWMARHGDRRPLLVNMYGITETTVHATCRPLSRHDASRAGSAIGRALADLSLRLLDGAGRPVPIGVAGEIHVGGAGVARGYLGRPALTAERFVPDPCGLGARGLLDGGLGARLYRSGDLARWRPDGDLEYLGRADQQVKIRGFRIEPGEIEAALRERAGVREAAVAVWQSGDDRRLAAYLTLDGGEPEPAELRRFLAARLPEHMIPAAFVVLASLPRTPSGKVDRRALPPPEEAARPAAESRGPWTPLEELVAGVFREVLRAPGLGVGDDFFAAGGHSLLAVQVASRLEARSGVALPLKALFETPTAAGLAARLAESLRAGERPRPLLLPLAAGRDSAPLSFAQQRLWFLHCLEPDSAAYNLPLAVRLSGRLDAAALAGSLAEIVRRHEALRTRFATDAAGEPVQEIGPAGAFALPEVDLRRVGTRAPAEALRLAAEDAGRPFDLARGPLFRPLLLSLGELDHVLFGSMHHVVSDGWSMGVLVRELGALYAALAAGRASPLPELPVQYGDFAAWQRGWLRGEALEAELAYWRERLAGLPARLAMPTDRPRPAVQSLRGELLPFELKAAASEAAGALARALGATSFMVVLAAWQAVLGRHAGQEDFAVGVPVAGRHRLELEGLVGFFVNTLVLRASLAGDPRFGDLLDGVRRETLAAFAHQDLPFEKLVEELAPERSRAHTPLFQVMLAFQNAPMDRLSLPGLALSPLAVPTRAAKFELTLSLAGPDGSLAGSLEYQTDLFDRTTVARLAGHLGNLLADAGRDPERRLADLAMLSTAEEQQLRREWNDTSAGRDDAMDLDALFAAAVARAPEAVALVAGDEQVTYGELDRRAGRLARRLAALGAGPETAVGLGLQRGAALVEATLAAIRAGGAYVPLDPGYPQTRLDLLRRDAGVRVLVTEERWLAAFGAAGGAPGLAVVCLDGAAAADDLAGPAPPGVASSDQPALPDQLAYVLYTSGSTGVPKGVAVPRRAVARLVRGGFAALGPGEVLLQLAPASFDAATFEIWCALATGARLVVAPPGALSPAEIGALLARHSVTTLWLTAGLFEQVVDTGAERLAPLAQLLAGGDVLSAGHVQRALAAGGGRLRVINGYGPTENTTFTCCHPVGREDLGSSVPLGRPIGETRVYLLDAAGATVPIGVAGELCAGGAGLARGYVGQPERTAERFVPAPDGLAEPPGARLYRTGDLARHQPGGRLEFLGRIDRQVKVRGFRIEPGEIEAALLEHPAVRAAAVVARDGEAGGKRLVAYLVAGGAAGETGSAPEPADLRRFLAARLPEHLIPSAFVALPALPLTANGKVDRAALPAPEAAAPGEAAIEPPAGEAARSPAEEVVLAAFREALRAPGLGVDDDFFASGGHSLLATQVVSRIEAWTGVALPLKSVFESPTPAELAAELESSLRGGEAPRPPLAPRAGGGAVPLSFAQRRLWFLDRLEPGSTAYNVPLAVRLSGALDAGALARSVAEVVRRHESLRTRFTEADGEPVQAIDPPRGIAPATGIAPSSGSALPAIDLTAIGPRAEEEARRLAEEDAARPFDLARGRLFRPLLLSLAATEHVFLGTMHHIVSDGWSVGVLVGEIGALYGAFAAGRPSPLAELPVQYADFALWQRSWLAGEALEAELAYWRERLVGLPPSLALPTDRPRPAVQSLRGASVEVRLEGAAAAGVRALARAGGATPFMILMAAWQALLGRHAGQDDLAVGTPIAGRTQLALEGLIGFFVNTLVLRADLAGDPSFADLLGEVRRRTLEAYSHQELPFERLVEELAPERSLAHPPLVQAVLALQEAPAAPPALAGLRLSPLALPSRVAKFELALGLVASETGFAGTLEHSADLFDRTTVARLAGHLEEILLAAGRAPGRRLSELAALSAAEAQQLLSEWNDTGAVWNGGSGGGCLHELFTEPAARRPDASALVFDGGVWSYGALDRRSNRLAHHLAGLGVGPEVPVALCAERSPELVMGMLAILKAGGAYVPLDPAYPRERLAYVLDDSRARVLLVQDHLAGLLPESAARAVVGIERFASENAERDAPPAAGVGPEHLAYVIYTSGSTGRPKGVMTSHRAIVNALRWGEGSFAITAADRVLLKAPISFDISLWELFWPLAAGGALVLARRGGHQDRDYLLEVIEGERVTVAQFVPSMLEALAAGRQPAAGGPLRRVAAGGEALSRELAGRFAGRFGAPLVNLYGPTEAAVGVTWWESPRDGASGPVPIGRPIANVRVHLLDAALRPVPAGVAGELYIGGMGGGMGGVPLARGYLGRPERTAERFVPDSFSATPGARLYRTGDLARHLPGGELVYLGRTDDQVKVRGFRIEPGEIEAALREHPAVREATVVPWGDAGERRLAAYLVLSDGSQAPEPSPAPPDLRRFLAARLPEPMVPSAFVALAALPLTPNGKVDRAALPAPEAAMAGEAGGELAGEAPRPPRHPAEEIVLAAFREALRAPGLGVDDDFFASGGHSLLATQVVSRIEAWTGVALPLRHVFESPTPAGLAAELERSLRGGEAPRPPLAPRPGGGAVPLSFAQRRLWFLDRLEPGSTAYNVPLAVRLSGALDAGALARSVAEVVRRHESLRTRFTEADGEPAQEIDPASGSALWAVDLTALGARAGEEVRRLVAEDAERPFDLARGPLFRPLLLSLAGTEHVFLGTMHHIVSDGWSVGVLVGEIGALYGAFAAGRPSPLAELPVQYADFALWQRSWLAGEALEAELAHWRERLAGLPPSLALPTDRPRAAVQSLRGRSLAVRLEGAAVEGVRALARSCGATTFMVLLAAWQSLLGRHAGEDDLAVGTPIAGRTQLALEGLIGFFVNTLVLRADLAGDPTFGELLAAVRRSTLEAYSHQELPFEKLVEELAPERSLAHTPLFQTVLAFQSPPPSLALPGLRPQPFAAAASPAAKFELTLALVEGERELAGTLEYSADLFDRTTVARLAGQLGHLLAAAAAEPARRLSALSPLSAAAAQQLLREWNDTAAEDEGAGCLHDLFAARAAERPEAVALAFEGGVWTYGELDRRSSALARRLAGLGVGAGSPVALCAERSPELVLGALAIVKAGGAYLPLDPTYPRERLAFMLADSRAPALLVPPRLAGLLPAGSARVIDLAAAVSEDGEGGAPLAAGEPDGIAYVIYTSGSTGRPKGVMVSHRAVVNRLLWGQRTFALGPAERVLQKTPISFDVSVWELFWTLAAGSCLVLARPGGHQDPRYLTELIEREAVTLAQFVPSMLEAFLEGERGEEGSGPRCRALRRVIVGGEALPRDLERRFAARLGVPLYNLYGPTEAAIEVTWWEASADGGEGPMPIGRPIGNARLHLLGRGLDRALQPVPLGVAGEVYLGGAPLARGYLGRPELTAERFVPDPFAAPPGGRLYRTGDLAQHLPGGEVVYLGRTDQQVKIRGVRIELGEVEAALREHPAVREAAATVWEDAAGGPRLAAYLVAAAGEPHGELDGDLEDVPVLAELRRFAAARLPEPMIPSAFVFLPALPLTPSGKVDRRALPAPEAGAGAGPGIGTAGLAPRDEVELALAQIWSDLLDLPEVDVGASFFEAGGHSLLAVRLLARIERELGQSLSLAALFETPTIEGLAARLRRQDIETGAGPLAVPLAAGSGRPFFCVHPIGGTVFCYRELAAALRRPFVALRARGTGAGEAPLASIPEMAARYLEEVVAAQPAGPYLLGGWSFGGLVALEMARRLEARGETVALLALLDPSPPAPPVRELDPVSALLVVAGDLGGLSGRPPRLAAADLAPLDDDRRLDLAIERAIKAGCLPRDLAGERGRALLAVPLANLRAGLVYAAGPTASPVALLAAAGSPAQHAAWAPLAPGGLTLQTVPGDHYSMMRAPAVEALGRALRGLLDAAECGVTGAAGGGEPILIGCPAVECPAAERPAGPLLDSPPSP